MSERPILFSGPMVRAILDGSKTQTRRVVKFPRNRGAFVLIEHSNGGLWPYQSDDGESENCDGMEYPYSSPYGRPGDRLWVRETWRQAYARTEYSAGVVYQADKPKALGMDEYSNHHRWKPSIHMPRWASRITLEVTGVRVERLQQIIEQDADAEGADTPHTRPVTGATWSKRQSFAKLWDSINSKRGHGWDTNPWVWVVEFKRVMP